MHSALRFYGVALSALLIFPPALALQISHTQFAFPGRIEIHVKPQFSELDLLFVIDDSGSMIQYQTQLAKNIPAILEPLGQSNIHIHAGVVNAAPIAYQCSLRDLCSGQFNGPFVSNKDPQFLQMLKSQIRIGNVGPATEAPFESIKAAFSEPLLSHDHPGFYRPRAHLAVIVLTDADDQSEGSVDSFVDFMRALKPSKQLVMSSIQASPEASCESSEEQGLRLISAVKALNGKTVSICDANFGEQLKVITSGLETSVTREIPLTTAPDFHSIVVTYGTTKLVAGDVHHGWVYDSKRQVLVLGDLIDWGSMSGDTLIVSFVPLSWK